MIITTTTASNLRYCDLELGHLYRAEVKYYGYHGRDDLGLTWPVRTRFNIPAGSILLLNRVEHSKGNYNWYYYTCKDALFCHMADPGITTRLVKLT